MIQRTFVKPLVLISFIAFLLYSEPVFSDIGNSEKQDKACYENISTEWGGQVRASGSVSWHQDDAVLLQAGKNPFWDGAIEARLKNRTHWTDWLYTDLHYELVFSGGDTRIAEQKLKRIFGFGNIARVLDDGGAISDDRRLFDLTDTILKDDEYILYHRLDRASLSFSAPPALLRLGRQAVTWGNGFLFNPMDLFNPFAPSDIIRDYKIGDDMALFQTRIPYAGEVQLLYVPRKNTVTNRVEWDASSVGGKIHLLKGSYEFDLMAARHYGDDVFGAGMVGYLGSAVWRTDVTYTFLNGPESSGNGFLSVVANLDYSWIWFGKNFYGLMEFFYNELGKDDYGQAVFDPELTDRIARGELFTLGKVYLAGRINMEVHPLLNIYVTAINNVQDPSGLIQPYAVADLMQDLQLTIGANISYGGLRTEFGGFYIPNMPFLVDTPDTIYCWATYYF